MSQNYEVLNYDPISGVSTVWMWDDKLQRMVVRYTADIEPLTEQNGRLFNEWDASNKRKEFWHVADVDNITLHRWGVDAGLKFGKRPGEVRWLGPEHSEVIKRNLNSSDFRKFKTAPVTL